MMSKNTDRWCVFLYNPKFGITVLDTGLTEEESQRQVESQIAKGEKDVQRLRHSEFFKLFGQHPTVKE
jgi:hypothetical protein